MIEMTARQPRRTRRRVATSSLPRPVAVSDAPATETLKAAPAAPTAPRRPTTPREHHVSRDYRYVHRDLILVAVVGAVVVAFIVGVSFLF